MTEDYHRCVMHVQLNQIHTGTEILNQPEVLYGNHGA